MVEEDLCLLGALQSSALEFSNWGRVGGEQQEECPRRQEETGCNGVRTRAAPLDSAAQMWTLPMPITGGGF